MIVPKEAGMEHKLVPMNMDPPEHGPYRHVLNKGLGPREIRAIESDIRAVAVALIDRFAADGKVNFCAGYANIFPVQVFLAFSGLPVDDAPLLTRFSNWMLRPEGTTPAEKAASLAAANVGFLNILPPPSPPDEPVPATTGSALSFTARAMASRSANTKRWQ